jgi:hypothetical protein
MKIFANPGKIKAIKGYLKKMNLEEEYKKFTDFFQTTKLPNPNHYPKQFEHYVKLYLHCNQSNTELTKKE